MNSISCLNTREKDQGPWKVAVTYQKSISKPYATNMVEFEITSDILKGKTITAKDSFTVFEMKRTLKKLC